MLASGKRLENIQVDGTSGTNIFASKQHDLIIMEDMKIPRGDPVLLF